MSINMIQKQTINAIFSDLFSKLGDLWNLNNLNLKYLNKDNFAIQAIPGTSDEIDIV